MALVVSLCASCFFELDAHGCAVPRSSRLTALVRRADSQALVCDAVVEASHGNQVEYLVKQGTDSDCRHVSAWSRAGEYTLTIWRDGLRSRILPGVRVDHRRCHGADTWIDVELSAG